VDFVGTQKKKESGGQDNNPVARGTNANKNTLLSGITLPIFG
jgi:hypothetical protein